MALGMQNHINIHALRYIFVKSLFLKEIINSFENIGGTQLKLGVLVANGVADLCAEYHGCSLYCSEDPPPPKSPHE
jgi:hypothetical protein